MKQKNYDDYWFHYVLSENPIKIKEAIKETNIVSEDIKIHVDIYGDEFLTDKNIIFIHGTSVYGKFYAEFCYNLLKQGYRVFAPDLIGHGLSDGTRGHFTMENFTNIIYDLTTHIIENYGNNVVVMGSSLGGITTLYCAANDSRLKGAICHNAAIFNEDAYKRIINLNGVLKLLIRIIPIMTKLFPKLKLSVFIYLDFYELAKSDKILESIDFLLKDKLFNKKYTLTAIKTQMRAPLKRPIEKIDTPIMIINGENDNLFSVGYMKELYNRINSKNKELVIIKDASHLIFQENIQESLENIINWLEKIL
ncbi:MAG: alpha/beta fold hydrolase [Promethearchaeati archaeon]